jgi:hypothetical protein
MVSATVAEATTTGVNIKRTNGQVVDTRRADLRDPADKHGINTDEADELAESMGWLIGTWRWQDQGGFYKAVCTPAGPMMTDAEADEWFERETARQRARRRP